MNTSLQYFMTIAEEKSIAAAARKLYISPQNLSNYVHRLEEEYGILFQRKPQFKLTPAGQLLYNTLQQINILEKGLTEQLKNVKTDEYEVIRFGIHHVRSRSLIPYLMPALYEAMPSLRLSIIHASVEDAEQLLAKGELDVFLGIDVNEDVSFDITRLHKEPMYLVVSDFLLERSGISLDERDIFPLDQLQKLPFILSPPVSRLRRKINLFCKGYGLVLNPLMEISDFELQTQLAAENIGACFIPSMLLKRASEIQQTMPADNRLHLLPVEGMQFTTGISLVTHRLAPKGPGLQEFLRIFQEKFPVAYYTDLGYPALAKSYEDSLETFN